MATPWVNPTAYSLLDQSQYGVSGEGGLDRLSSLYDWTGTQWAGVANPYTQDSDGGSTYTGDAPLAEALRSGGYQFMRGGDPVGNGEYRWVQDAQGNIVAAPQYTGFSDPAFQAAMAAAMGFAGGSAAGLPGSGGVGTIQNLAPLEVSAPLSTSAPLAPMPSLGASGIGTIGNLAPLEIGGALSTSAPLNQLPMLPGSLPMPNQVPLPSMPSLGTVPKTSGAPSGLLDSLLSNPKAIGGLLGGLLGGVGGSVEETPYTGPMPTITRGDWKPNAQAQMMAAPNYGSKPLPLTGNANSGLLRYRGQ